MLLGKYRYNSSRIHRIREDVDSKDRYGSYYWTACGEQLQKGFTQILGANGMFRIRRLCGNCFTVRNYEVYVNAESRVVTHTRAG